MSTRKVYPWDLWLDGQWHTIVRDFDFKCTVRTMQDQVRRTAAKRGGRAQVHRGSTPDGWPCLILRFYPIYDQSTRRNP